MNTNVFRSSTPVYTQSSRHISASELQPVQDRTTTTEHIKPASKSNIDSVANLYYPNVLNSAFFTDELENSRSEAVKNRNKITSRKRLFWWF